MFGGLSCPSLCGWYCRYLWAQQRAALLCRRDRAPLVRSVGKLLCSSVVLTLSADLRMYNLPPCQLPLHYCWGGCCPFLYGLLRDPLLWYPLLRYRWGRCCPFFIRLAARTCTVLPPPTLLLGQMLLVFYTVGCVILYCATPPLHYCWGRCCPFLYGWLRDPLLCYLPTLPRLNVTCFGAMSVGVFGDPSL